MHIIIHCNPNTNLLQMSAALRLAGYRLEHRLDGVHAVPIAEPVTSSNVVPIRPQIDNPFLEPAS